MSKIQVSKIQEVQSKVRQFFPRALLIFGVMSFGVTSFVIIAVMAIAPALPNTPPASDSLGETLLQFQTRQYAVRIFRRQGILRLNLYNRQTDQVEQREVPMQQTVADLGIVYTNLQGEAAYTVTVAPDGSAYDLKIQQGDRLIYSDRVQGKRVATETPTPEPQPAPSNQPSSRAVALQPVLESETIAQFQTPKYAVRIYSRNDELRMNLYNRRTDKVELKAVPVESARSGSSSTYSYPSGSFVYTVTIMPIGGYRFAVRQGDRVIYNEQGY